MTEKQAKEIQNEFFEIEAMARMLLEKAITTRKELERLNAPAPRKGRNRGGLTVEERAKLQKKIARQHARRGHGHKKPPALTDGDRWLNEK